MLSRGSSNAFALHWKSWVNLVQDGRVMQKPHWRGTIRGKKTQNTLVSVLRKANSPQQNMGGVIKATMQRYHCEVFHIKTSQSLLWHFHHSSFQPITFYFNWIIILFILLQLHGIRICFIGQPSVKRRDVNTPRGGLHSQFVLQYHFSRWPKQKHKQHTEDHVLRCACTKSTTLVY